MKIIEHFFQIIASDECKVCGVEGSLLCVPCASVKLQNIPERCYRCFRKTDAWKTCTACRRHSVLNCVYLRTEYGRLAKDIVHALKFNFSKSSAKVIARELATLPLAISPDTIIVHVPASTSHVRWRGFDQSAVIAKELSKILNLPHINGLARLGQQHQVGSKRETRQKQMTDAYRPLSASVIKHTNILLVDDVLTTGSTLESAALTLRRAGARSVSAVVFAQTL